MTIDWLPRPEPPLWAVNAGLPEPYNGDTFVEYVEALGLDPEPLVKGLTSRTAVLANVRLASRIASDMPAYFQAYARLRLVASHSEQQVREWDRMKRWWRP